MATQPDSLESQTFKELQEHLRIGIQNNIDTVLTMAYQEDLITDDELEEHTNPMWSKNKRAQNFLRAVSKMIKKNPANLQSFRGILEQEPVHLDLARKIGECSLCLTVCNSVSEARQLAVPVQSSFATNSISLQA